MRAPFYAVPPEAYIYRRPASTGSERKAREEPVRQWCAHELIRAYGNKASDLTFESPVRLGSKHNWIDILVSKHGKPWIVVECKEPNHSSSDAAIAQAVSYANAQLIQAEFAVYTNGKSWVVKRRVQNEWVGVSDIPAASEYEGHGSIDDFLRTLGLLTPLLHNLDEPLAGEEARAFLTALQKFFHGENLLTQSVDEKLRFGADCLLRVLSTGPDDRHYARSKLSAARGCFEEFRLRRHLGYELEEIHEEERIFFSMQKLMVGLSSMVEGESAFSGDDALLLRLSMSLLAYGRGQHKPEERFPALTATFHSAFRAFLKHTLARHFNVHLPDTLELLTKSDMKSFCYSSWRAVLEEERAEGKQLKQDLIAAVFNQLAFWKKH